MKKRSMLAIASLATGFVVAAISPSHSADQGLLGGLTMDDTLSAVDHTTLSHDSLSPAEDAPEDRG
ncbi:MULTISPECIES: hypothetical protein [Streptomyces]|uniref:hypothetical protein n=1 Tax=Streptomyces TaxID=1883 RepID=UPI001F399DFC|nr:MULTISPECIES: hypothetical protein [Streptomyces]MCF0087954.1 hypothetical protein [Streptomyces sp. MH192]MCF0100337.1 hypothetical protein [Streptomyces sp. MH191]MDX3092219.1 hypothetical protein [Streptomyces sp. ME12-02E]MDX3335585.1 hypothetical protein [Streptomyces sp. ME02-6978a]WTI25517.1 hypothetical protein OHA67_03770 [Streptomyces jietaisiensis]